MPKLTNIVDFSSPASFRIEVNGLIDENLSDYFGELTISYKTHKGQKTTSCLTGEIVDQAALIGILNLLYDMRLPIISVNMVKKDK